MKKILKISGIVLLILVVLLLIAPFLFKGSIEKAVKNSINKNVHATVEWENLSLSLFRSFPDARLTLKNLSVINKEPFAGDTLVLSEKLWISMGIPQLFKSGNSLSINELGIDEAYFNIKVDSLGNANYDIAKKEDPVDASKEDTEEGLVLDLQHYEIKNSRINYLDESSKTFLRITDFNHEGNGDFSTENFTLETSTNALVSLELGGTNYLKGHALRLKADIEMDLEAMKFTFLENEALINQLPLTFDGYLKVNENNNEIDLSFTTPSSDFKNFLAVIPETYAKNLDNVKTTGNFAVNGNIKGIIDDTHIPTMDISVKSDNASFKYPDLPKQVENIHINAVLKNESGLLKDTYLNLNRLSFKIDQDVFSANGSFKNLTENMLVNMTAKGVLNLANIEKAYPIEMEQDLNGILNADLTTAFDMNSLDKGLYQNIKSSGKASITNFSYTSDDMPHAFEVSTARLNFVPGTIRLEELQAKTGQSDIKLAGQIDNLMGFLFAEQVLKGRFDAQSNTFSVNDFTVRENSDGPQSTPDGAKQKVAAGEEVIKIPSFLDVRLDFNANNVRYDNLTLTNAKGTLLIKDETASLVNITSDLFGGNIALNGEVSTKSAVPVFEMNLGLSNIDITRSFNGLELFQNLVPIANTLEGIFNTNIQLKGDLNNDLTPVLTSLAGNAATHVLSAEVNPEKAPLMSRLDNQLDFINLKKLNVSNLKTNLTFNNGNIEIKPFDFKIDDISITAGGKHSMQNTMDYTLAIELPAKYFGKELGGAIANLSNADLEKMQMNIPVGLSGTFTDPKININTQQAVSQLTNQIIDNQKDKLIDTGKDKIKDALGDLLPGKDKTATDSTETTPKSGEDKIKDAAKDAIDNLFKKKKGGGN